MTLKTTFGAFAIIISLLFISCKKDIEENQESAILSDTATVLVDSAGVVDENDTLQKERIALKNLEGYRKEAIEKLKNATKEKGNKIYVDYEKKSSQIINLLNELETRMLEDYASFYNQDKDAYIFPDGLKQRVKEIEKSDIEFWEVGEGYAEIRLKPNHYYTIFKGKVTDDYDYYIKTMAKDNMTLFQADASLAISFEDVGKRVLSWEYFMKKYPKSPLYQKSKESFQSYSFTYIMGMDNSPTAEWSDEKREIYPENLEEFNRFITKNPKSECSRVVKLYIEQYNNGTPIEDIQKMVNQELGIEHEKEI